jgi:hypothetical protein
MNNKDREKMAQILSEMYDNDLNPEIETTKYQPYSVRDDDDGVDWYRAEGQHLKMIYNDLSRKGRDALYLGQYFMGFDPDHYDREDWDEFFSYMFNVPIEKLKKAENEYNRYIKNSSGGWLEGRGFTIASSALKKVGLDANMTEHPEKVAELFG